MAIRYCGDVTIRITRDNNADRYRLRLSIPSRKKPWNYSWRYWDRITAAEHTSDDFDTLAGWALDVGIAESRLIADAVADAYSNKGLTITREQPKIGAVYVDRKTAVTHVRLLPGWYAVCGEHLKRPTCHRHHTKVRVTCLSCLAGTKF